MLTTIETTGTINANHQIELDEKLPNNTPSRVRVIVLFDEDADVTTLTKFSNIRFGGKHNA